MTQLACKLGRALFDELEQREQTGDPFQLDLQWPNSGSYLHREKIFQREEGLAWLRAGRGDAQGHASDGTYYSRRFKSQKSGDRPLKEMMPFGDRKCICTGTGRQVQHTHARFQRELWTSARTTDQ